MNFGIVPIQKSTTFFDTKCIKLYKKNKNILSVNKINKIHKSQKHRKSIQNSFLKKKTVFQNKQILFNKIYFENKILCICLQFYFEIYQFFSFLKNYEIFQKKTLFLGTIRNISSHNFSFIEKQFEIVNMDYLFFQFILVWNFFCKKNFYLIKKNKKIFNLIFSREFLKNYEQIIYILIYFQFSIENFIKLKKKEFEKIIQIMSQFFLLNMQLPLNTKKSIFGIIVVLNKF